MVVVLARPYGDRGLEIGVVCPGGADPRRSAPHDPVRREHHGPPGPPVGGAGRLRPSGGAVVPPVAGRWRRSTGGVVGRAVRRAGRGGRGGAPPPRPRRAPP